MMKTNDEVKLPLSLKIAFAGLAGCTAELVTFPFETIKVWLMVRGESTALLKPRPVGKPSLTGAKPSMPFSAHPITSKMNARAAAGFRQGRPILAEAQTFRYPESHKMAISEIFHNKRHAMRNTTPSVVANTRGTDGHITSDRNVAVRTETIKALKNPYSATVSAIHRIVMNVRLKGFKSLYAGLSAGLRRQMLFCGVRIGSYDHIKNFYMRILPDTPQSIVQRILASATSGCLTVIIFQPRDVVMIRMSKDFQRYRGQIHAYRSIYKAGGMRELFKGSNTNCARLAIVNTCELVTYDIAKESIIKRKLMKDRFPCHFVSALIAGFVTTVVANPVDVIRRRYMCSEKGAYKNPIQCAAQLVKHEGMTALYKGFVPSYVRIGFWSLVMFVSYEQYKKILITRGWGKRTNDDSGITTQCSYDEQILK